MNSIHDAASVAGASSHSGTTVSSFVSTSTSGYDSRNKIEQLKYNTFLVFTYLGNYSLNVPLQGLLYFVEFVQIYSFAFAEPLAGLWSESDGYIGLVRTFGAGWLDFAQTAAVFWVVVAYLVVVVALAARVTYLLRLGEERWNRTAAVLRVLVNIFDPLLMLPCLSYCLAFLGGCTSGGYFRGFPESSAATCSSPYGTALIVLASVCAVVVVTLGLLCAALVYDCFPGRGNLFGMVNSRGRVCYFGIKVVMALAARYVPLVPAPLNVYVYGALLVALDAGIVGYLLYFLPLYMLLSSCIVGGFITLSLGAAVVRFASALLDADARASTAVYVAYAVVSAALSGSAVAYTIVRTRHLASQHSRTGVDAEDWHSGRFHREFEVEIATRHAYGSREERDHDLALATYIRGAECFPTSVSIRISQVAFMVVRLASWYFT